MVVKRWHQYVTMNVSMFIYIYIYACALHFFYPKILMQYRVVHGVGVSVFNSPNKCHSKK